MAARLVDHNEFPGVRPICIGETYRRLWAKLIIKETLQEAKQACGTLELCGGIECGIEAAFHALYTKQSTSHQNQNQNTTQSPTPMEICQQPITQNFLTQQDITTLLHSQTTDTNTQTMHHHHQQQQYETMTNQQQNQLETITTTLLDASNGFNELSRYHMLYTIKHLWPKASRFKFNCYKHFFQLIIRNPNKLADTIQSQEGIQQGDPLAMLLYGISLTPLIKDLKTNPMISNIIPKTLQPWYADDTTIVSTPQTTSILIKSLQQKGPSFGYYVQPEKSYHICTETQEPISRMIFQSNNIEINYVRGH